jgi:CRISPR/Cas system-associated exonuclease Cas4 (RecB family)
MTFGKIVHEGIEIFEKENKPMTDIVAWSLDAWEQENAARDSFLGSIPKPPRSFKNMYKSYEEKIAPDLTQKGATIEKLFKIPYDKNRNIYVTGKMDRVEDLGVFDWKTGAKPPTEQDLDDVQFYLYRWAHNKLYDNLPAGIYYGHLASGSLYNIEVKQALVENLEIVLDKTAEALYNGWQDEEARPGTGFPRITGYQCNRCPFQGICYRELYESDR